MKKEKVDTLIISDVHLGSDVSQAKTLVKTLHDRYIINDTYLFNRLILLGDIFEDLNFSRLKKNHWEFLSLLRKISNPKSGVEIVWIRGNHDNLILEVMPHLLGVEVLHDYSWTYNNKKYIAVHGDIFDRFLINNSILSAVATWLYVRLQHFEKKQTISRFLKRLSKKWLHISEVITAGAHEFASKNNADVIICGHTHFLHIQSLMMV